MQVRGSANAWESFCVSTLIAGGVSAIHLSDSVEGLVNIANEVHQKTECEGPGISFNREVFNDLLIVITRFIGSSITTEPVGNALESTRDIICACHEREI